MKKAWPEFWIVEGKRVLDENLGDDNSKPRQCHNCGDWFCMDEVSVCGACHRKMMVCCLVFEQVLGLPAWYIGLVILPDYSGYTFDWSRLPEKRGA